MVCLSINTYFLLMDCEHAGIRWDKVGNIGSGTMMPDPYELSPVVTLPVPMEESQTYRFRPPP
jgi:hypothetical protein